MYYFACIGESGICYAVEQWEVYNGEYDGNPYFIQIDSYDTSLITRKKYINGEWVDTTPAEAQNVDARTIGVNGEWLDDKIVAMDNVITNHTHSGYADSADLEALEAAVATKADATHTHDGYASTSHTHEGYAATTHTHDGYATTTHTHEGYAATSHTHAGYATANHTHTYADVGASPAFTNSSGGVEYSYGSNSGKNVLTEISNMPQGVHTAYAINGTAGNPRTSESFRFLIHKTSGTIGWVLAWDAQGSMFTNYQSAAGTFKGWKCLYDANPTSMILWSGEAYMQSVNSTPQVVTPSKKLSECRTGWMLLWSDYDPSSGSNDTDFSTTFIPKFTPSGGTWGGKCFYCSIPMYVGSDPADLSTEQRCIKPVYVHDDCLKGSYQNTSGGRNDVVLRAVYEV